jgi:RNA polymerase sigma factor (sigma-70 family)
VFATTHWSLILRAAAPDRPEAAAALATLCGAYWYPLYAFVRRRGHPSHDAQDLTQEFFARLLERNFLAGVSHERGRFRSFLLGAMKNFLANEWDKARAQKRGGDRTMIPIDAGTAEQRYGCEPADTASADKIYERRWVLTLLDQVLHTLRAEYATAGKAVLFDELKPSLTGDPDALPYAELGARVGLTEGAVKVAVHRLRYRYRRLLRETVAATLAVPDEVDDELRHLFNVLAS